jgi:phage terminase large subunit-like protein
VKAGPKGTPTAPPLDLRRLPKAGGARCIAFCERYITVPKGTGAKHRLKLRPWQKAIVRGVLDEPRPRQALVAIPAGNGKSTLAAAIGLYGLLGDGVEGAQVLVVASDERQARIIFRTAKRMVELDKDCPPGCRCSPTTCWSRAPTACSWPCPPTRAACKAGIRPWPWSTSCTSSPTTPSRPWPPAPASDRSLLLAISTPPKAGDDGVMRRLVDHGREGADPSFYFTEFGAPPGCAVDDEDAWTIANPALDDFLHRDALRATLPPKMRENAFSRYRLGQWVGVDDAWLPDGAWAACADATVSIPDGAEAVIAFDGSFNGDTTVLVVATVAERPHVDLVELWEADGHQVPIVDVEAAIRAACRRWRVLEVAADPFRWARSLQLLDGEGLPVMEYPQSPGRMTPATARFYEAVVNGQLTHSGDSRLARHVGNAVLREDARGARLAKERKDSPRRIDAAVAAVMAHDRAAALAGVTRDSIYI